VRILLQNGISVQKFQDLSIFENFIKFQIIAENSLTVLSLELRFDLRSVKAMRVGIECTTAAAQVR
jgi:hypothetical protein